MGPVASLVLGLAPTLPPPPIEISAQDELHAADYTLVWSAPASCPSAEEIQARVAALRTTEPGGDGIVDIRAEVVQDGELHRLALTTEYRGHSDTRELAARECAELGEAVALVVSFALAPEPPAPPSRTPPEPEPERAPTSAPTPLPEPAPNVPEVERDPPPRRAVRPRAVVRIGGVFEGGIVAGVTGGPFVGAGLAWPRWRLELHGAYLGPRRDVRAGVGARYEAGIVGARGCRRFFAGPIELPLCIGAEAGAVRATAIGAGRRVAHGPWVGPLVGAALAWRRRRVGVEPGLWIGADVVARAYGSAFTFGGVERFRQSWVSARLSAGLELFFP